MSDIATPISISFSVPAIISWAKGKSKQFLDDDEIPLAQLKKMKYETPVPDTSILDIERAALSLTKLHGDAYFKGPVHQFLTSPLLNSHGQVTNSILLTFMEKSELSPAPIHMDIQQDSPLTASVVVSQAPVTWRFFRASRGKRPLGSSLGFTSAAAVAPLPEEDILGECPLRPPPQL